MSLATPGSACVPPSRPGEPRHGRGAPAPAPISSFTPHTPPAVACTCVRCAWRLRRRRRGGLGRGSGDAQGVRERAGACGWAGGRFANASVSPREMWHETRGIHTRGEEFPSRSREVPRPPATHPRNSYRSANPHAKFLGPSRQSPSVTADVREARCFGISRYRETISQNAMRETPGILRTSSRL